MEPDQIAMGKAVSDRLAGEGVGRLHVAEHNGHIVGDSAADDIPLPPEPPAADDDPESSEAKRGKKSVAAQLVELAQSDYTLGVTDTDEPFGVHRDQPHIAKMLRGGRTGLRADLSRRFFQLTKMVASQQALADACTVLEGYAAQEPPQPVFLRVADARGSVYVDMADDHGGVIEIRRGEWRVIDTAPALFRRTKLTGAMAHPQRGDISRLWEFVPVDEDDRPLVLAWLVAVLVLVGVPHPILALIAEQGMTKSSATRCLVSLVDPSPVPLRKPPRDADGWITAANASWVVALDNMSGTLPPWLSDSLCRAVTGDGDVRRQLYTDSDVAVLAIRRCIIMNGVDLAIEQGDLAERVAPVDLKRPTKRRSEDDLTEAWSGARPHILGGLLDLAARALDILPTVDVPDLPRMADFAKVLAAVDIELGSSGLERYRERSRRVAADTLDHPLIAALVDQRLEATDKTSAELLAALAPIEKPRDWPKNARAVTGQLTRHAPALRSQGWAIDNDGGHNIRNTVRWTIRPPKTEGDDDSSSSSASSEHNDQEKRDESTNESTRADESRDEPTSQANLFDSSENTALTSEDRSTSQTSQNTNPSPAFTPPSGRGRCTECGCHIASQGHKPDCTANHGGTPT
jgi:hypothetical protein